MRFLFLLGAGFLFACASESLTPDTEQLKMGKDAPDVSCKSLGRVSGKTMSTRGTSQEALNDMKKDAARLSANYVKIEEYSGTGTAVTGEAFRCE